MIFTKSLCFASIMRFSSRSRLMVMVFFSFATSWIYPRISKRGQYITSGPWRQVRRLKFYGFIQKITSTALPSSRVTHVASDHWTASGRRLKGRRRRRRRQCGSSRWWWRCSRGCAARRGRLAPPCGRVGRVTLPEDLDKRGISRCGLAVCYSERGDRMRKCPWRMEMISGMLSFTR